MDVDNPVVRLCAEGMRAEGEGRPEEAHRLYQEAWDARKDDYDGCVVAHYLARIPPSESSPEEQTRWRLRWNEQALACADAANDKRITAFYPSLYGSIGAAHEELGNPSEALRHYRLAAERMDVLPDGDYRTIVETAVKSGIERLG